uniref:Uncharacterized protein n=1 Tax=Arundo donax TaxID=35708 RepID=A0A0A9C885_ARUDO
MVFTRNNDLACIHVAILDSKLIPDIMEVVFGKCLHSICFIVEDDKSSTSKNGTDPSDENLDQDDDMLGEEEKEMKKREAKRSKLTGSSSTATQQPQGGTVDGTQKIQQAANGDMQGAVVIPTLAGLQAQQWVNSESMGPTGEPVLQLVQEPEAQQAEPKVEAHVEFDFGGTTSEAHDTTPVLAHGAVPIFAHGAASVLDHNGAATIGYRDLARELGKDVGQKPCPVTSGVLTAY